MNRTIVFEKAPKKEAPTKQQVAIVLSGDDGGKGFSDGFEKKLVLKEPVHQNHSLATVLGVLAFQWLRIQKQKQKQKQTRYYKNENNFEMIELQI